MGPELLLAAKVAAGAASTMTAVSAAKGKKEQAEINSYIGRTRAIQTDTEARTGLHNDLGTFRAVLGANGQAPGVGTFELVKELRENRERDRRIKFGNRMQEAADWRMAGQNASSEMFGAMVGGAAGMGPSLFDLYEYTSG